MRITLLGNGREDYCSEMDYKWTLEKMGHEVVFLQESQAKGEEVLAQAIKSDALFWIHTWGWRTPGLPMKRVLYQLKLAGIPSFTYHLDLILPLNRQKELQSSGYDQVDHFFSVEQDFVDYLNKNRRMAKGHYLPPAVIERDCVAGSVTRKYKHDIIFTGSYDYHHQWPYRRQLLDFIRQTYGDRFHRYGREYEDQPDAKYIMGRELNYVYASAKVVVGDTFCPNFTKANYWSNRVPETLGKGGFLIHPYIEGMEEHFIDRKHLVFYEYGNFEQLKGLIDYYLDHPDERQAIQEAAMAHVKANHTFTNRLETMLEVIK